MAILNSLDAHNLPIFQPILMILVSKFMVHRALSDKTYKSFGLLSPLIHINIVIIFFFFSKWLCSWLVYRSNCPQWSRMIIRT